MTLPDRICDPHHHLWDIVSSRYVLSSLLEDLTTVPQVKSTIFVECDAWYRPTGPEHLRSVGETEWVANCATDIITGIVAQTELRLGSLTEESLDAHRDAAGDRLRGIRQRATWDPSHLIKDLPPHAGPQLLLDPRFRDGFSLLAQRGLTFDAWVYFPQLLDIVDLAQTFPETKIILNHLGGPIVLGPYLDRQVVLTQWRSLMSQVAKCPNVVLKIGGIGMPLYGQQWHKQDSQPTSQEVAVAWGEPIRWCIETFEPSRCMFESNFPVDRFSLDYVTVWATFDLISSDYSQSERDDLFCNTALKTYQLN